MAGAKPAEGADATAATPNPDDCPTPPNGLGAVAGAHDDCTPPNGDRLGAATIEGPKPLPPPPSLAKGEDGVPQEELALLTGAVDALDETPKNSESPVGLPPQSEGVNGSSVLSASPPALPPKVVSPKADDELI